MLHSELHLVLQTCYYHHHFCWLSPTPSAADTKDCLSYYVLISVWCHQSSSLLQWSKWPLKRIHLRQDSSNFWPEKTCMEQINLSIILHSARVITSLSPLPSRSSFRFLPGISFPPPNPTPTFCLNTLKSCSASSAHSGTRCLPSKWVCRSVLYAFSASCRDTNSKNPNPRVRESNFFFGSLTNFKWRWALLQGTDFLSQFTGLSRKEKGTIGTEGSTSLVERHHWSFMTNDRSFQNLIRYSEQKPEDHVY